MLDFIDLQFRFARKLLHISIELRFLISECCRVFIYPYQHAFYTLNVTLFPVGGQSRLELLVMYGSTVHQTTCAAAPGKLICL